MTHYKAKRKVVEEFFMSKRLMQSIKMKFIENKKNEILKWYKNPMN